MSALPLQNFDDDPVEFGHIERFGEVIAESGIQRSFDIARQGMGADGNHRRGLDFFRGRSSSRK